MLASAIAMDKSATKRLLDSVGIPVPGIPTVEFLKMPPEQLPALLAADLAAFEAGYEAGLEVAIA